MADPVVVTGGIGFRVRIELTFFLNFNLTLT